MFRKAQLRGSSPRAQPSKANASDGRDRLESVGPRLFQAGEISDVLHFNQGLVCFKLGALDRAEAAFLRALELVPENPKVNFYLGNIYEKKKQFYNAIFQYRKAGANIMVKRVQAKIETERKESSGASGEETLPPRRRTQVESPISTKLPSEQETSRPENKVTVDHIDRLLFLGALQQTPYTSLSAPDSSTKDSPSKEEPKEEGAHQDAGSREVLDEPSETSPAVPTNRTVVELTEPVIPDLSLTEMAKSKVPTSATSSLFTTSPPTATGPRQRDRSDEDTAKFGILKDEPIRPESAPLRQHLSLTAEEEKDSTQLYSRLRRRDDIFRYVEDNLMEVNFSGKVFVKQGTIYSYSGNLTFWVKPQREESVSPS